MTSRLAVTYPLNFRVRRLYIKVEYSTLRHYPRSMRVRVSQMGARRLKPLPWLYMALPTMTALHSPEARCIFRFWGSAIEKSRVFRGRGRLPQYATPAVKVHCNPETIQSSTVWRPAVRGFFRGEEISETLRTYTYPK
jgi:hypothetical protein